jgi:hypothetical protein
MKAAGIFRQYIWLVETIYRFRRITLNELNEQWVKTEMSGGIPMHRSLFNRHRKAIEDMFGLCIECKRCGNEYPYYIENEEALKDDNIQHWMLDSLSISNLLMESQSLKDRIILEKIPAGKQFLQTIIHAMKLNLKLELTYRKFGQEECRTIIVEPYAIKVFKQRWYMLANNYKRPEPSIYALDRIISVQETNDHFVFPKDFDTELFFKEYYGVLCTPNSKAERIVIRAYPPFIHYLRTLPLHHSQKELESTPEYADFEFYLRPTFDFLQELFSQMHEVEILEPVGLRQKMKEFLAITMERYE